MSIKNLEQNSKYSFASYLKDSLPDSFAAMPKQYLVSTITPNATDAATVSLCSSFLMVDADYFQFTFKAPKSFTY